MKSIKYIILAFIGSLFLMACQDIESLKRDNPLDGKNEDNIIKGVLIKFDSYKVHSDNNGDKVVNPGETVGIKISLKNTGTSTANKVKATFSTTSSYVSGFSPTSQIEYGDISANSVKWADYTGYNSYTESYVSSYTIRFTVSNTTPTGTQIPINISMVDESGNTWTDSFNVPVQ
jgi:hypothetical protein